MSGGNYFLYFFIFIYMIGIYKITSPTGRIYIGSSNNIENRKCKYKSLKCSSQTRLYNSLKKYGFENHLFEILEECDIEILLKRELYYGLKFNVLSEQGLNCRLPKSEEGYSYMSQETKDKISESNKIANKGIKFGHYESKLKKLDIHQVREIKLLLIQNELTQKQIASLYNVSRKIISNINSGKCYSTLHTDLNILESKELYIKLKIEDYGNIKNMFNEGKTQKEIADLYQVTQSHISRILNNEGYIKSLNK
jgi:group I intron endonuclease